MSCWGPQHGPGFRAGLLYPAGCCHLRVLCGTARAGDHQSTKHGDRDDDAPPLPELLECPQLRHVQHSTQKWHIHHLLLPPKADPASEAGSDVVRAGGGHRVSVERHIPRKHRGFRCPIPSSCPVPSARGAVVCLLPAFGQGQRKLQVGNSLLRGCRSNPSSKAGAGWRNVTARGDRATPVPSSRKSCCPGATEPRLAAGTLLPPTASSA